MLWNVSPTLTESSEWHAHDIFEFVLCRTGTGLLVTDQHCTELASRRTILITPNVRHRYVFRQEESAELKIVCLTSVDIAIHLSPAQTSVLRHMNQTEVTFTDHSELWPRLWGLTEMIPEGLRHGDRDELNVAWGAIALLLAKHMQGRHLPRKVPGTRYLSTIQQVYEWIDTHLEHAGTLDEIAARFGLSRSLLTREFRRHAGTSIIDYVNTRRLQKAGTILASTEKSIAEAAFESGFSSLANFYRRFKALYGVTPIEFRKLIENNSSPNAEKGE